ncbi:hypothetical protein KI387_011112, partial [Taxus chinensis]
VNETRGLLAVAESRAVGLEARYLHARERIHMLQERLVDQWAVPIAVVPLRIERPDERRR